MLSLVLPLAVLATNQTVTSISTPQVAQGQTYNLVYITGTGFYSGVGVAFRYGGAINTKIRASSVAYQSPTSLLIATLIVDADAPGGSWEVAVGDFATAAGFLQVAVVAPGAGDTGTGQIPTTCKVTHSGMKLPAGVTCSINASTDIASAGVSCMFNTIYTIIDWIFIIVMVLVVVFVILGAFTFLTSAGDPEKTKTARNYILWASIGLAVALLARAVPSIVSAIIGTSA